MRPKVIIVVTRFGKFRIPIGNTKRDRRAAAVLAINIRAAFGGHLERRATH